MNKNYYKKSQYLPYCIEAERAVIGGILLDPSAFYEVKHLLAATHFSSSMHQAIFTQLEIVLAQGPNIDLVILSDAVESSGFEYAFEYLVDIVNATSSARFLKSYVTIITEHTRLRNLVVAADNIIELVKNKGLSTTDEVVYSAQLELTKVLNDGGSSQKTPRLSDIASADFNQFCEYFNKQAERCLPSGFEDLDRIITGFIPGNFYIIAGRPSMGKTSLALNIIENIATLLPEQPLLFFSLEMSAPDIFIRLLSSRSNVPQTTLRTGDTAFLNQIEGVTKAYHEIRELNIYIDDGSTLSVAQMVSKAKQLYFQNNGQLGMIVVDYLQLMTANNNNYNRAAEIAEISKTFKALARELDIPVIALSQLNRNLDDRPNRRPTLSDLRDSGALEQDADTVMFLYRDEVYNRDTIARGLGEIIVSKQRNGPIGTAIVAFQAEVSSFRQITSSKPSKHDQHNPEKHNLF
jgi:replicative DNA helicase